MVNPHKDMRPLLPPGTGPRNWVCQFCAVMRPELAELNAVECSYSYQPCKTCGESPECAPDCQSVADALNQSGVYVINDIKLN